MKSSKYFCQGKSLLAVVSTAALCYFAADVTGLSAGDAAMFSFKEAKIKGIAQSGFFSSTHLRSGELSAIAASPEPGTWAMLLGGLGLLITGQRLRRSAR